MLKRAFALSDQGAKDLAKGIIATACANLIQIIPASLLLMVVMMLLEKAAGTQVNVGRNIPFFVGITLVLFGMIAIAQLVQYNLTYTAAYKESANRRIVLAEKLRKLPLSFFEKKNLADLTTTIMGDCTALERTFSNAIPQLLGTILMFVITSVGLAVLDWRLALCIIVPVPVASIVVVLARKAQSKAELENLEAKRCAYDAVQEYVDTIKELKAYSKTNVYLDELDKKLENVIRCSFRNELAPGASTTAAQFILRFGLVAVLLIGGNLVIEGMLSIPMLILFLLFAGRIYDPFTNCFMLLAEVFAALVSIGRMKQIDNTQEQTGSDCCNNIGCDIEFKDVYFSYNEEPVLTGVSFVAKQGEITALVGPSGSGKSTLCNLIARFYDVNSGMITIGGTDIRRFTCDSLLKNISMVFQNVYLFRDTIKNNIKFGSPDATDEQIIAAAKAARCHDFIMALPDGYDTVIGEGGSSLSGGEKQRISIARAMLKDAPIVILDEATASIDPENEHLIQEAISALTHGKTIITIAHRLATIENADQILVIEGGTVAQRGTHKELLQQEGTYKKFIQIREQAEGWRIQ